MTYEVKRTDSAKCGGLRDGQLARLGRAADCGSLAAMVESFRVAQDKWRWADDVVTASGQRPLAARCIFGT